MVWCCFWPCGQTSPQVYAGLAADESAASSRLIAGSQPECLRHSRRKKSLAGQKNGRHFAVRRKTGIFPAKSAFSRFRTRGKRNCHGQFRRRGSGYGVTFQPAVVVSAGIGLLRSISIRRMGIPHHRFGAVEKRSQRFSLGAGEKGVLRPLTPRSKDVAARIRARDVQSHFAAKPHPKFVKACLPIADSIIPPDCRQPAPFVCAQKGRKSAVIPPAISRQAKLPRAISTPRFRSRQNPPAGRPLLPASYRRAIFMEHSVYALSSGDRPACAGRRYAAAGVSVKTRLEHPACMRRNKFPPNRFGAVEKR